MPSLQVPLSKKGPRKLSKDAVATVENLDTKQLIVPTRKQSKQGSETEKPAKEKTAGQRGLQRQRTY